MNRLQRLRHDLEVEIPTTRKHLTRLPPDRFTWKPHEKSNSVGRLASHLIECIQWTPSIFSRSVHDADAIGFPRVKAQGPAEILRLFDEAAAEALAAMDRADPEGLDETWSMTMGGRTVVEKSREAAFRDMTLHHLIHHRGQLTVYLRLLDIPLAWTYGPTADEGM